jgi:hypothetical protein
MTLPLAILHTASLLVPGEYRAAWLAEWRSELWYVRQQPAAFCAGAFRDALWVRRNRVAPRARLQSPARCILFLAALAAFSVFLAFRLPLPRALLLPSPYRDARSLVMISSDGTSRVTIDQFLSLSRRIPYRFRGMAFYRPVKTARLSVALASDNLFELLGVPVPAGSGPRLVLTRETWRTYFRGDPRLQGRVLEVAGQKATFAGVLPEGSWDLPGRMDAWLLEDPSQVAQLPSGTKGYLLARLGTTPPAALHWSFESFQCASLAKGDVLLPYLLTTLLSIMALVATTTFSLGEYPANHSARHRRWIFFILKAALLLPVVCFGSLDVASLVGAGFQAHGLIVGTIAAMRWALADQRRRCPVCLRVLSNPTRIGGPSHVFLDWYGTELICVQGHGLLYVPEIPTSCYSTQRWQYLDPSWSTLFSQG